MSESPKPKQPKSLEPKQLNFFDALREIKDNKKVRRVEWQDLECCVLLKDGFVKIFIRNKFYELVISDGDLYGEDWVVVE